MPVLHARRITLTASERRRLKKLARSHTAPYHLARRRKMRPHEEYRPVTEQEMAEFEEHFDKRKVELGSCGRPYQTPCQHEHACIRCPMLQVNPKMLPRLDELEADLRQRRDHAVSEGWLGEIEGIDLTLRFLADKRDQTNRLTRATVRVDLGMPGEHRCGAAQLPR